MLIGVPRELLEGECRVAVTPDVVERLAKLGFSIQIQAGAGDAAQLADHAFEAVGATLAEPDAIWRESDLVLKIHPPTDEEVAALREGGILISFIWPAQNPELLEKLAARRATVIALDKIPRTSVAQKMDVLSSMANIAGYRAVIEAANRLPRFFGGQITAAGKTPPATVLVIGAGVAGLAAIGAARSLGAVVRAFDTREAAKEQVKSLGGKFLMVDIEEDGEGGGGYGKVMSQAFIDAEMALFREQAAEVDVVITTALIPGRPAPKLWMADMVEAMKPGSVVVDLAASQGGNCELTVPGEVAVRHGVHLVGYTDLTSRLPTHASQFLGSNLRHLLAHLGGAERGCAIDMDDEHVRPAVVVHQGVVSWPPPAVEPKAEPSEEQPSEVAVVPEPEAVVEVEAPEAGGLLHSVKGLGGLGVALALVMLGSVAPNDFLQSVTVFVLACFVGWQVIWNVTHALHTPLMSVTNAISGIIIVGGILQAGSGQVDLAAALGAVAILVASINIAGGFLVTQRMLQMFRK